MRSVALPRALGADRHYLVCANCAAMAGRDYEDVCITTVGTTLAATRDAVLSLPRGPARTSLPTHYPVHEIAKRPLVKSRIPTFY
ncbi:hypothetical protein J6590_002796 [Homalodisca vitripennis]|nr:hypothetical protein J6590_002796 [Homalodisca vitripennis]